MEVRLIIFLNAKNKEKENRNERNFTTKLKRVPNTKEFFYYTSKDKVFYYGEVINVETFKNDDENEEKIFITIKEFD